MGEFEPFHSAVNRIPVLRRASHGMADGEKLPRDLFSDGPATGHDHLTADRWSGSIDLKMTVRTPMVFGEQKDGVVELPMRGDELVVPPTMVKGMISRAYETLTCSRFRVFGAVENTSGLRRSRKDHSERLTYRADPAAANSLLPGRVCVGTDGHLAVEILDGFDRNSRVALIRDDRNKGYGTISCKNHPKIRSPWRAINEEQVFNRFRSRTPHGEETEVQLTEWSDQKGRHLMVTGVWDGDDLEVFFEIPDAEQKVTYDIWGYPCRTSPDGRTSRDLCNEKFYERFFFKADENGDALRGRVLPLGTSQLNGYAEVLRTYREHREDPGDTHLLNRAASSPSDALTEGDLVFVQLSGEIASDRSVTPDAVQVVGVLPTMVGRRPYSKAPRELAATQKVLPVAKSSEASAADRVFGYVVPKTEREAPGGEVASRGHLSFGTVDASGAHVSKSSRRLAPLLSPKPSSARRFLTTSRSGETPKDEDSQLSRHEFFSANHSLGAAAHPVHRELLDCPDFPEPATNPTRSTDLDKDDETVRMTAQSWVRAGSVLRCTVGFTNLSEDELGALIWILTPENLVPAEEKQEDPCAIGFLRMGMGKPLGLGAIETRITKNGLHAIRGDDLADNYANLNGCLGSGSPAIETTSFPLTDGENILRTPWVKALQRAAFGYSDGVEVRYMTLAENRENNQTDSKTGRPKEGRGLSPVDLCIEAPGPMTVPKPRRKTSEQ